MVKAGGIIVAVVIAIVAVGFKFSNKSDASDDVREQVTTLLVTLPDYEQARDYYEGLCDTHHELAFEEHYKMGSRRTGASFDHNGYIHDLLQRMAADAQRSGYEPQAKHLRELEKDVYVEEGSA